TKQNETEAELHARIRELKAKLEHEHERPARAIEVDPASLPKSYRERFEAMRRRLEQDFEWRVKQRAQEETRRIIEESDLPYWREQVEKAEKEAKWLDGILNKRRPIVSKKIFRIFSAAVQPDTRTTLTAAMLHDAAVEFNRNKQKIEIALCGKEAERPKRTLPPEAELPRTRADLMARKAARTARERAKRAAATRATKQAQEPKP